MTGVKKNLGLGGSSNGHIRNLRQSIFSFNIYGGNRCPQTTLVESTLLFYFILINLMFARVILSSSVLEFGTDQKSWLCTSKTFISPKFSTLSTQCLKAYLPRHWRFGVMSKGRFVEICSTSKSDLSSTTKFEQIHAAGNCNLVLSCSFSCDLIYNCHRYKSHFVVLLK
jgi:hypothetical protein